MIEQRVEEVKKSTDPPLIEVNSALVKEKVKKSLKNIISTKIIKNNKSMDDVMEQVMSQLDKIIFQIVEEPETTI